MPRFLRMIISAALATAVVAGASAPAIAAAPEDGSVTWMVRPSDGVGEDGRSWVELELDAGESAQEHLLVRNLSASPVSFRLTAADGYFTDSGRFNMLTSDTESVDAGTWIEMQDIVEVPAGEDVIVPFTVTVPENATPGDHPAGVAAAIRSTGAEVGIESRVGFRVMTRVNGALAPAAAATVAGEYRGSANPFEAGRVQVDYALENTGNTRLTITPEVRMSTLFGLVSYAVPGEEIVEIAPGESRTAELSVPSVWPLFAYTAEVVAVTEAVGEGVPAGDVEVTAEPSVIVAVPWPQLIVLAIAVLLIWLLWRDRRRRDRRTAELVAQAREQALAEASGEPQPALRRHARTAGFVAVVLALIVVGQPAVAATWEDDSFKIRVEIAPQSDTGATPSASPQPTSGGGGLAATGAPDLTALVWGGLALAAAGTVILSVRRRRVDVSGASIESPRRVHGRDTDGTPPVPGEPVD